MEELTIDPRFRDALSKLTHEEFKTLEANILADGEIKEAISLWGDTGIIIDGHHRYKIAKKHELPFRTEKLDFVSADEVLAWIYDHQFGRRNMSGAAASSARAKRASLVTDKKTNVASMLGVSDRQLRTDKVVSDALDEIPEGVREKVRDTATQAEVIALSKLPEEQKQEVVKQLETKKLSEVLPKPRHKLNAEQLALVREHFDTNCLQRVMQGAEITDAQIRHICSAAPVRRQLIFDLVAANDISFAEAIDLAKRSPKKQSSQSLDITRASEKVEDICDKLLSAMDIYAELVGIHNHGEYKLIRHSIERISPALAKVQPGQQQPGVARPKAIKTAQALLRCVDDLHQEKPDAKRHTETLNKTKEILEVIQEW